MARKSTAGSLAAGTAAGRATAAEAGIMAAGTMTAGKTIPKHVCRSSSRRLSHCVQIADRPESLLAAGIANRRQAKEKWMHGGRVARTETETQRDGEEIEGLSVCMEVEDGGGG